MRMEQKVTLKAMKNALEVYKEFDKKPFDGSNIVVISFYENVV
jgi:hypothetical protein